MNLKDFEKRLINNLPVEVYKNVDFIVIDEIREFTERSLKQYGTLEKLEEANKIADVLKDLLRHKKLLDENTHQAFIDIMIAAALLHNLFYDESNWRTLIDARFFLGPIAEEMKINQQASNALFSTIEGQMGESCPITEFIPKPGTPTEVFASIVWFVKNYT